MNKTREFVVRVTTTGSAGSASGSASTDVPVRGYIEAVQFDFHASAASTTDTTLTEASGMARTLITITNSKTDVVNYPRVQATDSSGAAITGIYDRYFIAGEYLTVAVAQCDALTNAVVVRIYVSEV